MSRLTELGYSLRKDDYVFNDDPIDMFVGGLALRQSKMQDSGRGDSGRYWSERSRQLLLVMSSALIPESEYGLYVVTGLPVSVYLASQENRRKVKRLLEGRHEFTVNGKYHVAHIIVERVIMEGAGATIAYGLPKARQGIIDIGGLTTDTFASQGQEPLTHLCGGTDLGVEMAGDMLQEVVSQRYQRILSKDEIWGILHRYVNGSGKISGFYANRQEIPDLREIARTAVDIVGKQIAGYIATTWNDCKTGITASSFAKVLLIGGGALFFARHIQQALGDVDTPDEPEFANSLGYC